MKSRFPIVELGNHVRQVSQRNRAEAGIEVFSVTNSEGFTSSIDYFSKEVFSKDVSNYKIVNPGQFAYNPSRVNVGSIDYLRHDRSVLVSPLYIVFEGNKDIHADYLLRYLKSDWGNAQIRANTEGAVRDSLKFKGLESIRIPLPPLNDQIRIAQLLGKVGGLIAQRKQHLQQLHNLLSSLFLEIFGDPRRNEKGWDLTTIGDLASDVKYGTSASARGGKYKYLRMNNITQNGYWNFESIKYIDINDEDFEKYSLRKGDLVFNRTNSKELVGKTAIYDRDEPVVIAGYLIRVRFDHRTNPWFVWGHLNSKFGKNQLFNVCRNIVGMANINAQELKAIPILKPPIEIQNRFAVIVEKMESLKTRYQQSLIDIEDLYRALSQQAFKGELDLSKVEINRSLATEAKHRESLTTVQTLLNEDTKPLNGLPRLKHPSVKKWAGNRMDKQIIKVVDALRQAGIPMSGQQLLAAAGYSTDSGTEVLEKFFLDIRDALSMDESIVKLHRDDDGQDWFDLVGDVQSIARKK